MNPFIQLFHHVITYPVLNIVIWLYQYIQNFSLTIILFACITQICLVWLSRFLGMRVQRKVHMLEPTVSHTLRRYSYDPETARQAVSILYKEFGVGHWTFQFPRFLSYLNLYVICGLCFALVVLGGSSLREINGVLYPFVPHLSSLPDYAFSFSEQTVSLVRPGMIPWFLIVIALITLLNAYLSVNRARLYQWTQVGRSVTVGSFPLVQEQSSRLGCTFLQALLSYPFAAGIAIIFALSFAAGTLLYGITGSRLDLIGSVVVSYLSVPFSA